MDLLRYPHPMVNTRIHLDWAISLKRDEEKKERKWKKRGIHRKDMPGEQSAIEKRYAVPEFHSFCGGLSLAGKRTGAPGPRPPAHFNGSLKLIPTLYIYMYTWGQYRRLWNGPQKVFLLREPSKLYFLQATPPPFSLKNITTFSCIN